MATEITRATIKYPYSRRDNRNGNQYQHQRYRNNGDGRYNNNRNGNNYRSQNNDNNFSGQQNNNNNNNNCLTNDPNAPCQMRGHNHL